MNKFQPFFLYLRSFHSDRSTTEKWKITSKSGASRALDKATPKVALEQLLEPAGLLVELGGTNHLGLGQVRVGNENWWELALYLIIHATAIFINVGASKSLLEEIEFILNDKRLLRRSFLIMEPTHLSMLSPAYANDRSAADDRIKRWNELRIFFHIKSVELPLYSTNGSIVSLFDAHRRQEFAGISRYGLYDLLHRMYVDLLKLGSYDIGPNELCPCRSLKEFQLCHGNIYHWPTA